MRKAQRPGGAVEIIIANQGLTVNEQNVNFCLENDFKEGYLSLDFLSYNKYTVNVEV